MTSRGSAALAAGLAVWAIAPARAQVPNVPSPDRIIEETRRQLEERSRPESPVEAPRLVDPGAAAPAARGGEADVRFTLTRVDFDRSAYLAPEALQALVRPLLGTEVGIADLRALVERVNALYAASGVPTARAILPPQNIAGGVVRIALVEGRVGDVSVESASPRVQAQARAAAPASGALADPRVLERSLRRFNLLNDTQLRARLAQGTRPGTTDVVLTPDAPARVGAEVFADNGGFRSTGAWQAGAVLRAYRLLGAADRLVLAYSHARGVDSGSGSWGLPLADWLRADLGASYGATRLQAGPNRDVRVTGASRTFSGSLTGLAYADRANAVTATLGVQNLYSTTDVAGPRVLTNLSWAGSAGVAWNMARTGVTASLSSEVTGARVRERVSATGRDIAVLRGTAGLTAALGDSGVQARARADWQYAFTDELPGFLLYQIGGPRSNRAWAPGTAAGDRGVSASAELAWARRRDRAVGELMLFADHAQVRAPGAFVSMQAVGAGAALSMGPVTLRATVATGVGWRGVPHSQEAFVAVSGRF